MLKKQIFLGFKNFMKDIQEKIGIYVPFPLYYYWAVMWLFVTPASLFVSILFIFEYRQLKLESKQS